MAATAGVVRPRFVWVGLATIVMLAFYALRYGLSIPTTTAQRISAAVVAGCIAALAYALIRRPRAVLSNKL